MNQGPVADEILLTRAGGQGNGGETERRMLMQAVSALKMENACLVDALGTRMSEVEALRSAAQHTCPGRHCTAAIPMVIPAAGSWLDSTARCCCAHALMPCELPAVPAACRARQ